MNELINLILLGGDDNIKREAVFCLSKVSWFLMAFVSAPILIQTLHTAYTCIYPFRPVTSPSYQEWMHHTLAGVYKS